MTVLDDTDKRIIEILRRNPILSQVALAKAAGINRNTCASHLRHLEEKGIVRGQGFVLNQDKDQVVTRYLLIKVSSKGIRARVVEKLVAQTKIAQSINMISGEFAYVVQIADGGDAHAFARFHDAVIQLNDVEDTRTLDVIPRKR